MTVIEDKCLNPMLRCFQNVSEYKAIEGPHFHWHIVCENVCLPSSLTDPVYFILDTGNNGAFSHWVLESATWLPYFVELKKLYPFSKLIIDKDKHFKRLFIQYHKLSTEDICFFKDISPSNYCFFHTYLSLNDIEIPSIYYKNVIVMRNSFLRISPPKTIPILYLPRGKRENLEINDRTYNIQDYLKEIILNLGGTVYETDSTENLEQQIDIVKRAHIIILDYGSNLWINGTFAKNSEIICLNVGWTQHLEYPSLNYIWEDILNYNTITQIYACPTESVGEQQGLDNVSFRIRDICIALEQAIQDLQDRAS